MPLIMPPIPRKLAGAAVATILAAATAAVLAPGFSAIAQPAPVNPGPDSDRPIRPVISPQDIQKIRQAELRPTDNQARIQISNDTRKSFCDKTGEDFESFRALTPTQQACEIIDKGDDDLRSQIHITTDPESLAEFRRMQTEFLSGCASSNCHGGHSAGDLVLINPASDDAGVYTNFYLLQRYSKRMVSGESNGMFGGDVERKLILRTHGEDSLLVNFSLPTSSARAGLAHPPVNGRDITPIFHGRQEPRCRQLVQWMDKSLKPVEPTYDITDYVPPATEPAATQPAIPPGP